MKFSSVLSIMIAVLLVTSCKPTGDKNQLRHLTAVEKLDAPPPFKYTTEVIPLESKEGTYLGVVFDIEVSDKYIYILDRSTLNIFDHQGNFIKKLKRGKGPGELTNPFFLVLDTLREKLYINEKGNVFRQYDLEANYLSSRVLNISMGNAFPVADQELLCYSAFFPTYGDSVIVEYNWESERIGNQFLSVEDSFFPKFQMMVIGDNFELQADGSVLFSLPFGRKLYTYSEGEVEELCSFDFGKHELNDAIFSESKDTRDFLFNLDENENLISSVQGVSSFGDYTFMELRNKIYPCAYFSNNSDELCLSSYSHLFSLPETKSFKKAKINSHGKFVFLYNKDALFEAEEADSVDIEIAGKSVHLTEESNPVIVIVTCYED